MSTDTTAAAINHHNIDRNPSLAHWHDNESRLHRAFQRFCNIAVGSIALITDDVAFERAFVLPLSITTAAAGLYQQGFLGLLLPQPEDTNAHSNSNILIWRVRSSVGSSAVQLAVKSGATVVTTSRPTISKYYEDLGGEKCFDHHITSVEDDIFSNSENHTLEGGFMLLVEMVLLKAVLRL